MMTAKILLWSAVAFMVFGTLAFIALVAAIIRAWRLERRARVREAMDPVRRIRR